MIASIPLMNQNRSIEDLGTQNPELRFESGIFEPRTEPTTNLHASSWTLNTAKLKKHNDRITLEEIAEDLHAHAGTRIP